VVYPAYQREQPCDLCLGNRFELIARRDRRGGELETVLCRRCGLISHGRIPTDEDLANFYSVTYRQDYHGEVTPSPRRVVRAWKNGKRLVHLLGSFLRPTDRVFEIGAGIGCTVKQFELAGFDAHGIEPGEGFGGFGKNRLHANLENQSLEDVPVEPVNDLVLLVHVIEHLRSPAHALRTMHGMLSTGGKLYVECPNVEAPHAAPGKLYHYAHIYNFTHLTLRTLAESCGYELVEQFSATPDRSLAMLFVKGDHPRLRIDSGHYQHAISHLKKYNWFSYHLRPSYWLERATTVATHYAERRGSTGKLNAILDLCRQHAARGQSKPLPRAA